MACACTSQLSWLHITRLGLGEEAVWQNFRLSTPLFRVNNSHASIALVIGCWPVEIICETGDDGHRPSCSREERRFKTKSGSWKSLV